MRDAFLPTWLHNRPLSIQLYIQHLIHPPKHRLLFAFLDLLFIINFQHFQQVKQLFFFFFLFSVNGFH